MSSSTVNVLSATDRKQLCKITEGRFEMLRQQINARKSEIDSIIRKRVLESHQADIDKVRKDLASNTKKVEKLDEDYNRKLKQLEYEKQEIINKASDIGLKVSTNYSGDVQGVEPKNINESVKDRSAEITKQYAAANISLRTRELEVLEEISVAGLKSEEAKDFLGKIPDIDKLLPAPENIPELQA